MFCDGCGGAVQSGQAFCSRCGKQIVGPVAVAVAQRGPGRVKQHVHLLAILWLALSALNGALGLILVVGATRCSRICTRWERRLKCLRDF